MFKSFKFIEDKFRQLNQADQQPTQEVQDTQEQNAETEQTETPQQQPSEQIPQEPTQQEVQLPPDKDPSQIANPDKGSFISDIGDAEYASIMIRALASNPAYRNKIPKEFLKSQNTQNAQQIIQFVRNIVGIKQAGGEQAFQGMSDQEFFNLDA